MQVSTYGKSGAKRKDTIPVDAYCVGRGIWHYRAKVADVCSSCERYKRFRFLMDNNLLDRTFPWVPPRLLSGECINYIGPLKDVRPKRTARKTTK